jgi:ribosomal protein S18 acetylase RimI-like enzyme
VVIEKKNRSLRQSPLVNQQIIITRMNVRLGTSADWPAVLPMLRRHRALHEHWDAGLYALRPDAEERFKRWLGPASEDPRALLMVVEDDGGGSGDSGGGGGGALVGFLTALVEKELPMYVADEYAVIRDIWIEPAHRGRGLGKALVDAALRELDGMGLKQVRIHTAAANEPARKLLAACGFRVGTIDLVRELGG